MYDRITKILLLLAVLPLRLFNFGGAKKQKAVVVFYTGKLGDLVCLTSVLRAIKEKYSSEKLIFYGRSQFLDILKNNPFVDEVLGFKNNEQLTFGWLYRESRRLKEYQIVFYFNLINTYDGGILGIFVPADRRFMTRTKLDGWSQKILYPFYHTKEYKFDHLVKDFYFEALGDFSIAATDKKNQIFFTGRLDEAESFFLKNALSEEKTIGVSVSSGKDYKIWPKKYWIELLDRLADKYKFDCIFFGTSEEADSIENIRQSLRGRHFSILDKRLDALPYYLKKCRLFISVDTGPLYIADALGVSVVDIMGSSDDNNQRPENNCKIITNRQFCEPFGKMLYNGPMDLAAIKQCFDSIKPEQVFHACEELLNNETASYLN